MVFEPDGERKYEDGSSAMTVAPGFGQGGEKDAQVSEKVRSILSGFTAEEIHESTENGVIRVNCEFCSTEYLFDPADFFKPH